MIKENKMTTSSKFMNQAYNLYHTEEASRLVQTYWCHHYEYLIRHELGDANGPIDEDGLCQCISLGTPFAQPDLRFFLFVSTFFDQFIYTDLGDVYSEFRKIYNFPKINSHGSPGMAHPSWFLYYERFDHEIFGDTDRDESWKRIHEKYWIIIKNNFQIIMTEILEWFINENKDHNKLIMGIQYYFKQWPDSEDSDLLVNIFEDFLLKSQYLDFIKKQ